MAEVFKFNQNGCVEDKQIWERCGKRGQRAFELASLHLPVVPGFVIDSHTSSQLEKVNVIDLVTPMIREIENEIGRKFASDNNPLLLKIICSSNLSLPIYPTVFNVGLSPVTIKSFAQMMGGDESIAWFEYCYLLKTAGTKLYDIPEETFIEIEKKCNISTGGLEAHKKCAEEMRKLVNSDMVPDEPFKQLEVLIKVAAKHYYDPDLDLDDNVSIMVQAMVFGNMSENDLVGVFHTRNIITGEAQLSGYYQKKAYTLKERENEINTLPATYLGELQKLAKLLESRFHELRQVKFIIEKGKLWLINQTSEDKKSTQSHIRTLLDLYRDGFVKGDWLIKQIPPGQLASLLHPIVDMESVKSIPSVSGGMTGSPGAAIGRVFFSADKVMEVYREALQRSEDTRIILCVQSSFAEDVKAIEVGQGVIAVDGGYSSHAPVVARSMGKIALLNKKIVITGNQFTLDGITVKEGDYITLDVPIYKEPTIYLGKGQLINPDVEKNGLVEFVKISKEYITPNFVVRANADLGRDAKVAKKLGAFGIGLCRTEHMFFAQDRIMRFREMILANTTEERILCLKDLQPFQTQDFYELFETMAPNPVTIRLLDAPLHEFLPHTPNVFDDYCLYLKKKGMEPNRALIEERISRLNEFNPMLGHRGCRVAITYPEIYEMQVRAILEAAVKLKKKGVEIQPEIMIPIVMDPNELNMIRNGKKIEGKFIQGIVGIADDVFKKEEARVHYKIGTMVELPAAALLSDELARYAEFFSYGTNDLTQTTNGLSRDDANSFFPAYTEYDLLPNNPFQVLGKAVKELIGISATRGRLTRPDIKLGLCGEHGADPVNIQFCIDAGLQYVSCSPYSVPIAILAVAQSNINAGIGVK